MRTWTFVLIGLGIRGVDPDIKIGAPGMLDTVPADLIGIALAQLRPLTR
jgi:hypothetical protein